MKFSILDMISKQQRITLRAGGIVALALFLAVLIHPALAQYGTAEQIACTNAGGEYYLNVDCNSGGLPPGFMSGCWICIPAAYEPPPPSCTTSSACAANTCAGSNCVDTSDGSSTCGNTYAGTKNCTPPVYTCQDYGYQYGTVGNCWNSVSCSRSNSCGQSNTGMTTDFWGTCSVSAPSESSCPVIPPSCTNNSYCSGTTYISSDTCNGQTGSTPNSPSCGYVAPPSCTPSAACAASTPVGNICYDSCGNGYAGLVAAAPTYSESTYAPSYSQAGYYSQGTYAPVGCGTPAANLTAAPTRVRSGQTSTLTLSATGVTTSCTITGPGINTTVAASSCGVNTSAVTPPITSQVTYKVTCDGVVDISKIIVNLVPKVTEF